MRREDRKTTALLELASMIDEDQPIDWDSEEGVARGDDERAVLAELRVLAALTRVYRDPDAVGLDTLPEVLVDPERTARDVGEPDGARTGRQGRIREGLSRARRAEDATWR